MSKSRIKDKNGHYRSFLDKVIDLSDRDSSEIMRDMGLYYSRWSYYRAKSPGGFPIELVPSLRRYSGLSSRRFMEVLEEFYPVV